MRALVIDAPCRSAAYPDPSVSPQRSARRTGWLSIIRGWLENHMARRRLQSCASLDPRLAKDIGLSPEEIEMECSAPFWVSIPSRPYARRGRGVD
jgi:uncharacterized protein YjiS (DUF1127 family)